MTRLVESLSYVLIITGAAMLVTLIVVGPLLRLWPWFSGLAWYIRLGIIIATPGLFFTAGFAMLVLSPVLGSRHQAIGTERELRE